MKRQKLLASIAVSAATILALLLACRVAVRSAVSAASEAGRAGPRLVIERTERDFGTVKPGVVLRETFTLSNAGARRLVINEEHCCGRPRSLKDGALIIPPGGSRSITLRAGTTREYGLLRRAVEYTSSDPDRPRFTLALIARIARPAPAE